MLQNITLESRLLLTLEEKGLAVFTTDDAKNILETTDSSVWHILNSLTRKKRIKRIQRGRYLLIPARAGVEGHWGESAWAVVSSFTDEYYVGFWTAMNYWGMTEQIPYTVFVATTKRRRDMEFGNQRFEFVTLAREKFFGYIMEKADHHTFNISSMEKTIVDGLMHPEYCGGMAEMAKAVWNVQREADWQKTLEMAERTGINVVLKRLGYLLSVVGIQEGISEKTREKIKKSPYHYFDPTEDKKRIHNSKEYGLIVNVTGDDLLGWMGH